MNIYVDGDGCPVKAEVYKVAERHKIKIFLVANKGLSHPLHSNVEMVIVSGGFDAADDWIAEHVQEGDLVITGDIPLADRCIKKKAWVLGHKGVEFTEDSIGSALAMRELMTNLRAMGESRGGPSPIEKKDRSLFLSKLDQILRR